jgi:hypothetical protein
MWVIFGFIVLGIILYVVALCSITFKWDLASGCIFWGSIFFLIGLGFMQEAKNIELEQQAKDILIGGNPYEMVIQYELKDSLYVPVDTIFVLKAKK